MNNINEYNKKIIKEIIEDFTKKEINTDEKVLEYVVKLVKEKCNDNYTLFDDVVSIIWKSFQISKIFYNKLLDLLDKNKQEKLKEICSNEYLLFFFDIEQITDKNWIYWEIKKEKNNFCRNIYRFFFLYEYLLDTFSKNKEVHLIISLIESIKSNSINMVFHTIREFIKKENCLSTIKENYYKWIKESIDKNSFFIKDSISFISSEINNWEILWFFINHYSHSENITFYKIGINEIMNFYNENIYDLNPKKKIIILFFIYFKYTKDSNPFNKDIKNKITDFNKEIENIINENNLSIEHNTFKINIDCIKDIIFKIDDKNLSNVSNKFISIYNSFFLHLIIYNNVIYWASFILYNLNKISFEEFNKLKDVFPWAFFIILHEEN